MTRRKSWLLSAVGRAFLAIALLAVASTALAVPAAGETLPGLAIENQALRLVFQKSPAPYVDRLIHKASGQSLIASPAHKSLFSLGLAKADGGTETIDSERAGESNARLADSPTGKQVVIRYAKFPGLELAVEVTVTCDQKNPLTLWSLVVENNTGRRLITVRFPLVVAVPAIGQAADDCLVLPAMPGTLIENPAGNWRVGQSVTLRYPGDLSAQFIAYQDRSAGLYLTSMDTAGHPMGFTVLKQANGFRISHDSTVVTDGPAGAKKLWKSPYPIAMGVTQGAWYDTADLYKQWAVRQPWCAKTLAQRGDIPAWWKAGPDVHVCEVRTYDPNRTCKGSFYPQLLEYFRTWREKIDGPVVAMLAGWENHRRWTAGDYFPLFDTENARRVLGQLKQEGFRPFFYLSGMFYTYRNEGRDGGDIAAAARYLADYVVDEKTGKPREFVLNESNPSGDWKRHSYEFCVGATKTKEFFCQLVDQAHAVGVDVLQMDQTTGGAGNACYSTAHQHSPGPGLYQSHDFWDLLDAMRSRGKGHSADFILLHEEPHEQLIPHLDGFHVREYKEKFWYRGHPGAVGIPLFSYLYHEYAIGYGGDSASLSKANSRFNVRSHAMNLVTGRTPGGSVWSSPASMYDAHPDQIAMIRNHCRLLKTRAQKHLMLGKMLHPYDLAVPSLALDIPVQRSGKWVREPISTPAVLTSSWQSPEGRIGHLFVNLSETIQPLKVRLDTRNTPVARSCDAEIYRSTTGESFQPLWQSVELPKEFTVDLAPLEVVFVELRVTGS